MFEKVALAAKDKILGLAEDFNQDTRPNKINLGIGVYQNQLNETPTLDVVRNVEELLLTDNLSKTYLDITGDQHYCSLVQELLLGKQHQFIKEKRVITAQTPGGSGAIRLAAELCVNQLNVKTVWVSNPTWANHMQIFKATGLIVKQYTYYNKQTKKLDFKGLINSLENVKEGDMVLFHACCHNPTGCDLSCEQWESLAQHAKSHRWLPIFDIAYQGFAQGIEQDAAGLRIFANVLSEFLIANSFSKNFCIYNERAGALTVVTACKDDARKVLSQLKAAARSNYSNPPAHGARIVARILGNEQLKNKWIIELAAMRDRIKAARVELIKELNNLGYSNYEFISKQHGMFCISGLTDSQIQTLRQEYAIYMLDSGRINIAGITANNIIYLCKSIAAVS